MLTVEIIKGIVAKEFGVSVLEINSPRRSKTCSRPRHAVMLIACERLPYSFPQIARCMLRFDHTSIIHGVKRAKELEQTDIPFRNAIARARKELDESDDYAAAVQLDGVEDATILRQASLAAGTLSKRLNELAHRDPKAFLEKIAKVLS